MDKVLHREHIQKHFKSNKRIEPIKCPFCNGDLIIINDEMRGGSFDIICINDKCRSEWIDIEDIE